MKHLALSLSGALLAVLALGAAPANERAGWYTEGDFHPSVRLAFDLTNELDVDRVNQPVVIRRDQMPIADLHELEVTVVDPSLPGRPEPSAERLKVYGGHDRRAETNGQALLQQMDDLDKDGVWDELFFVTDIGAKQTKRIYVYLGFNQRGWNPHETHAAIGSYCRHLVPFWETKHVGWKLWYPSSVDVFGKREPMLMAHRLYMENLDGYGVTLIDSGMGSDIQAVENTFGGGAVCLFESRDQPGRASVPRFTPARAAAGVTANFNAGPIGDARYAFDVVANGPVRSMIRVKTMNWNTGQGSYELEQLYTAYAHQSYSTCRVKFTRFLPMHGGVQMGAGIRKRGNEAHVYQRGGIAITAGPEDVLDPDDGTISSEVDMIANAIVVKDEYRPQYQFVPDWQGNHAFRVTPRADGSYEYLIAAAWSEGAILKTYEAFEAYVLQAAREYQHPLVVTGAGREERK
jgi:hypothetical protein